jgi:hypothetical protein
MAPDGSRLLRLDALSVQTALEGSRPIVWMIIGMIKRIRQDVGRQGKHGVTLPPARDGCRYLRWSLLRERLASPTRKQTEDAI